MFSAGSLPPPRNTPIQPKSPPVPDGDDPSRMVRHPFEGDGALLAVTFHGNGTLTSRTRFVRTNAFTNERKFGRKLYVGMDGTRDGGGVGNEFPLPSLKHHLLPGLNKKRKNTSNTRPVFWGKKLLTLWEGGLPYKLDALALSTEGRSQLGGILKSVDPLGGKATMDAKGRKMLFYGNKQGDKKSEVTIYEFNEKFRLDSQYDVTFPSFALLSDFGVTEKYVVFVQPKVDVKGLQFMMSKEPGKTLTIDDKGDAVIHIVKRSPTAQMKTITLPASSTHSNVDLQIINSYETPDGDQIILDVIRSSIRPKNNPYKPLSWPWAQSLTEYSQTATPKSLWRYTISVKAGTVDTKCLYSERSISFATINSVSSASAHQFVYATIGAVTGGPGEDTSSPPQGIIKFNTADNSYDTWFPPSAAQFCGEPTFAPRSSSETSPGDNNDEDDGYVLSVMYDGESQSSDVLVFDAKSIGDGPISRVNLGVSLPHGHYGCFAAGEGANWSAEEITRRAKLADKMEKRGSMWNEVKSDFSGLGLRLDDFEEYFGDIM
eukprot:CAMPEP_0172513080 /NCGR_PEP_ID=MMETSP1066-20121228/249551_1 /TAXON_ID=671091 /ORGANISM="Coscinodiscus wailesii, Strain CCMP2513" /LENGTH=544 /DNA_ID=CAMNT_0013293177 /DNA_START=538 /DNA_END=2172 /DNA_ORIENTATION=+